MTETLSPILPSDIESLALAVVREACERRLKLVTAESCTGGLLASLLTDVDGYAHAFERGFVAYTDEAKRRVLGVPGELLERFGAVSGPAARAMAEGALAASAGDVAVAVTGFAGTGAPGDEPGLVYFGLARRYRETVTVERRFGSADRGVVRIACLRTGLKLLRDAIA
jgi:nicotinamide-nucleotide amidase